MGPLSLEHYELTTVKDWIVTGNFNARAVAFDGALIAAADLLDTLMTTLYETNIDDMDPRLWPHVIDQLLVAGALDAWLTPIIMKKGRPAFTLSALCDASEAEAVRVTIFRETTTIGIREMPVARHVLDRSESTVEAAGQQIGVKTAYLGGEVVNRSVEWDDVVAAAQTLGLSAKDLLTAASASATKTGDQPL